jgi:coenzyme F420-reducing hydrogenase beta subunit
MMLCTWTPSPGEPEIGRDDCKSSLEFIGRPCLITAIEKKKKKKKKNDQQ